MNLRKSIVSRYIIVSIFFYGLVIHAVRLVSEYISYAPLAIGLSFLVVYGLDFFLTSLLVFQTKMRAISLARFLVVTAFFFGVVLILSKTYLLFISSLAIAAVLTGLTLSPLRFLVAKNYVFNPTQSLSNSIKDSIGQVSRGITSAVRFIDRKNKYQKASNYQILNYLKSLLGFQNSTLLMNLDLPWWPFSAIKYIEEKIQFQQFKVFEWGSGASTVWLSRRVLSVVSVEHDKVWSETVNAELFSRGLVNVTVNTITPKDSVSPRVSSGKKGFVNLDFFDYVDSINNFGKFDMIVIDGRARVDCWKQASKHLEKGGLIVFDNYNRNRYQIDMTGFKVVYFSGLTPASVWSTHTLVAEKV